jgi:hypothetical protein
VRHAQGIHNVEGDKNYKAYLNPEYFDAHLTPLGWEQVHNLRKHVHSSGLINQIDLVIASPLMRCYFLDSFDVDQFHFEWICNFIIFDNVRNLCKHIPNLLEFRF